MNVLCIADNGQLYLVSIYPARAPPYPGRCVWDQYVPYGPRVCLKIGGQIYGRVLVHVTDPAEHDAMIQAQTRKYPNYNTGRCPGSTYFA